MVDTASDDIKHFSCGKCRTKLFTSEDLQTHNSQEKKFEARREKMGRNTNEPVCQSYYVEMADWMNVPYDGETQQGKIQCPKCNDTIGKFFHFGGQCSCGCWVNPAYQLHKAKVDEIKKINIDPVSIQGL